MKYDTIYHGIFFKRVNRFLAYCHVNGRLEPCHVPNTSRLSELCVEGREVILTYHDSPLRKTKYTIIHIEKAGRWVNIDSQAPNEIVTEALAANPELIGWEGKSLVLNREVSFGNSRFDLFLKTNHQQGFLEIKGVTLEENGIAMFPGAPTKRGTKHLLELVKAKEKGYWAGVFFCVQLEGVNLFRPHVDMDSEFSETLLYAHRAGVHIFAYGCQVSPESVELKYSIPFVLDIKSE